MRKRRFLIPIIVFVVSTAIAYSIVVSRIAAVREMINEAGREGKPVFITYANGFSERNVFIQSMDQMPVQLLNTYKMPYDGFPFVSEYGVFGNFSYGYVDGMISVIPKDSAQANLPNISLKLIQTDLMQITHPTGRVVDITHTGKKLYVNEGFPGFTIIDVPNREIIRGEFGSPLPLVNIDESSLFFYAPNDVFWLSPDSSVLVFHLFDASGQHGFSRYEISDQVWNRVNVTGDGRVRSIGPEGNVVAYEYEDNGQNFTEFTDGRTGDELFLYQGRMYSLIGERWVVCRPIPNPNNVTILYDIENDWQVYNVPIPNFRSEPCYVVGMYEPPAGGVEEMLEMRAAGE